MSIQTLNKRNSSTLAGESWLWKPFPVSSLFAANEVFILWQLNLVRQLTKERTCFGLISYIITDFLLLLFKKRPEDTAFLTRWALNQVN